MENHLKRVLNLVRKTGDTMIVVDKDSDDSFVVMDLDQYEMLLDSQFGFDEQRGETEEEPVLESSGPDIWDVMPGADDESQTWDIDQLNQEELAELEKQYETFANRHVKEAIEEVHKDSELAGQPPQTSQKTPQKEGGDDYGEEQFYLEPVE
jgi:PHD/YefM family antitoxin component YafN of YafNO toxin-antitoxin module